MACMFCSHWKEPEFDTYADYDDRMGECTLNPIWISTHCLHYCGQMVISCAGELSSQYTDRKAAWAAERAFRERAIRAENAAKEARKKLRDMKQSTTVAEK